MDIEEKFPFEEVLEYLREHRGELQQGQLMFEYIMIDGINIFPDDARELARWAKLLKAKVNLIPMNTSFNGMHRPSDEKIYDFWRQLVERDVAFFAAHGPRAGELILGLRPEHAAWGSGDWQLQVDVVETLGAERLVYCRLGEALFTVRIDGTLPAPQPGDRVPLGVRAERLHWFDATNGQRIA